MTNLTLTRIWRDQINNLMNDKGYRSFNNGHTSTFALECPGLSAEDIQVSLEQTNTLAYLVIKGSRTETELEQRDFSIELKVSLGERSIEKVEYTVKNGILYVNVEYKANSVEEIKVVKK